MSDEEDFASDTSDDDYVPSDGGEDVSEASGEEEDLELLAKDGEDGSTSKSKTKLKKKTKKTKPGAFSRQRKGGIRLEEETTGEKKEEPDNYNKDLEEQIQKENEEKKQSDEKKKADDLWASFMKDVGPTTKPKPRASGGTSGLSSLSSVVKKSSPKASTCNTVKPGAKDTNSKENSTSASKITITKEYDFAGETVRISKEVDANSKEAKAEMKKQEPQDSPKPSTGLAGLSGVKRPGGGLGSVLGKIGKKPKIGTLEKSRLDWDSFKKAEGIEEELQIHNRGKEGYLERKEFLERTDLRQFEIEKNLRLSSGKR